jgi:hypothetical protein
VRLQRPNCGNAFDVQIPHTHWMLTVIQLCALQSFVFHIHFTFVTLYANFLCIQTWTQTRIAPQMVKFNYSLPPFPQSQSLTRISRITQSLWRIFYLWAIRTRAPHHRLSNILHTTDHLVCSSASAL